MIEFKDIENAKSKITYLEHLLEDARITESLLESKYLEERADYKVNDWVCPIDNPECIYTIDRIIIENGKIVYGCKRMQLFALTHWFSLEGFRLCTEEEINKEIEKDNI